MRYNYQALLRDGRLAQLVELPLDVRKVTGSSPVPSTIKQNGTRKCAVLFYHEIKGRERRSISDDPQTQAFGAV